MFARPLGSPFWLRHLSCRTSRCGPLFTSSRRAAPVISTGVFPRIGDNHTRRFEKFLLLPTVLPLPADPYLQTCCPSQAHPFLVLLVVSRSSPRSQPRMAVVSGTRHLAPLLRSSLISLQEDLAARLFVGPPVATQIESRRHRLSTAPFYPTHRPPQRTRFRAVRRTL